jgi:hypothetical protein
MQGFVGVAGFEPATSCSQSRRDNRATLHPVKNFNYQTSNHNNHSVKELSDRDRIRTCDRLIRNQMLYPAELRDPVRGSNNFNLLKRRGRDSNPRYRVNRTTV